ncbi:MAG: hypothetical protein PHQ58_22985 [Rhodoferax sp.]|uniref:hypothetical protein n=1 Tax=Rhodoferax sp. TaxID=50421 RepID=UPI00260A1508|nr:hypothetical protein [Rhodoferax sp.]MDD2883286.1 hypothetical protein [Rhodoferax sp.]
MTSAAGKTAPLGTPLEVRARIMTLGWPSMAAWANAHGYQPATARLAMRTWGLRTDRVPHGGLARAVVRDLRATMEQGITPSDLRPTV